MKEIIGIVATTGLDSHGDLLGFSLLESLVEQTQLFYIPLTLQHDPRIAPIGRIASARIKLLSDGEYGVEATMELFDPGEQVELGPDSKQIPIHEHSLESLDIWYDRNSRDHEDQALINDIASLFGTKPREEVKKSLDPLTVLTIGGTFVLGGIAKGFFGKLGADAYECLKTRLKKLMSRRKGGEREKLLRFQSLIQKDNYVVEVEVISTNPADEDIERFFQSGLMELDRLLPSHFTSESGLKHLVFHYDNGHLRLAFGVRRDGIPVHFGPTDSTEKQAWSDCDGASLEGHEEGL